MEGHVRILRSGKKMKTHTDATIQHPPSAEVPKTAPAIHILPSLITQGDPTHIPHTKRARGKLKKKGTEKDTTNDGLPQKTAREEMAFDEAWSPKKLRKNYMFVQSKCKMVDDLKDSEEDRRLKEAIEVMEQKVEAMQTKVEDTERARVDAQCQTAKMQQKVEELLAAKEMLTKTLETKLAENKAKETQKEELVTRVKENERHIAELKNSLRERLRGSQQGSAVGVNGDVDGGRKDPSNFEEVDLRTPPDSPDEFGTPVGSFSPSDVTHLVPVPRPISLSLPQSAPPRSTLATASGPPSSGILLGQQSYGVEMLPEVQFPLCVRPVAIGSTTTLHQLQAAMTTPCTKKCVRPEELTLTYSKKKTSLESEVRRSIRSGKNPIRKDGKGGESLTDSVRDILPDLEPCGFERHVISKQEVLYEHVLLKDSFSLLCKNFSKTSNAEVVYVPISLGQLISTLPEYLKGGEITFEKSQIRTFQRVIACAVADQYGEKASTPKKPTVRQSV